jgi:hypothetical protein
MNVVQYLTPKWCRAILWLMNDNGVVKNEKLKNQYGRSLLFCKNEFKHECKNVRMTM